MSKAQYDPKKLKWKIRMWLASWIDYLDKRVCWQSICMWAMGYSEEVSVFPWSEEYPKYQSCTEKSGGYCGKCHQTGRLKTQR